MKNEETLCSHLFIETLSLSLPMISSTGLTSVLTGKQSVQYSSIHISCQNIVEQGAKLLPSYCEELEERMGLTETR